MKKKNSVLPALRKAGLVFSVISLSAVPLLGQSVHPLEPVKGHYKTLGARDNSPGSARSELDTVTFPWAEYSKGALTNSLMRTYYLSSQDESKLPGLVKFPANSSDQTRAELDYMLELQQKRTKAEVERAEHIANIGSWPNIINPLDGDYAENRRQLFYIAEPVGSWFNDQNFPAVAQLLLNCIQDIRVTEFRLKRHFKRPRPYHLEPALHPLARINSPSFPSGHTLWAFTEALVFSEIIPGKREQFIARAEEVRWSRELLGIHYPSDDEASRIIAWHLLTYWQNSPAFLADLEKAKAEWTVKKARFEVK